MASLFRTNPEQFIPNTVGNFTNAFTTPRSVKEQIDAGYAEANTHWNQLRFNPGARYERTRTVGRTFDILPAAVVRAAGFTAATIPYVVHQYRNGVRPSTYGSYDNLFLSGGAKYSFSRNLVFQVAASQSIGRPNYDSLAGVIAVNDTTQRVTLPNPNLKPETSDKFFVSAQYYIEPAGTITVSAFQTGRGKHGHDQFARHRRRSRLRRRHRIHRLLVLPRRQRHRHPPHQGHRR